MRQILEFEYTHWLLCRDNKISYYDIIMDWYIDKVLKVSFNNYEENIYFNFCRRNIVNWSYVRWCTVRYVKSL